MKKTLLLSILVFLIFGFNFNNAAAQVQDAEQSVGFKLTEREAAKIAYCDYIKQHGEIMIPELGLRVVNVVEENGNYTVTLAIYEKITNKVVNECALYTINVRSGRILSVKKFRTSSQDAYAEKLAAEILDRNFSNIDSIIAKINGSDSSSQAAYRALVEKAKQAAIAKAMNGQGNLESISEYFDNRIF
ncbi:MAG TPA: hypothetical protein PKW98_20325 [Candidatus Wallbacteria bacterium]|nr:MAG: hypothetical protein BWY32_03234 [bacterium ADurb.Bin243]HOD39839.1 hypothetical protein [Candidatus Wallbacteria bacterium]HPG60171.1 hypothetical protein [Candidatus Wallbacteria bacterium]